MSLVKICGLTTPETLDAALAAGADLVGFVRFPRSPRHVALDTGRALSRQAAGRARRVLLLVNPDDAGLDEAVAAIEPDIVQLHGSETPERVRDVRRRTGRPVMKALPVAERGDLAALDEYRDADMLLLDAKAPPGAALPGGNGQPFDWTLLANAILSPQAGRGRVGGSRPGEGQVGPRWIVPPHPGARFVGCSPLPACCASSRGERGSEPLPLDPSPPVMLSGGLTPDNVAEAILVSGLSAVDVSSGVESRPGEKDPARIERFIRAARAAFAHRNGSPA